jgi:hypothetical protein
LLALLDLLMIRARARQARKTLRKDASEPPELNSTKE